MWNIQTLAVPGVREILDELKKKKYKMGILALQDTRWPHRKNKHIILLYILQWI